jgi:hypothetical protein
MCERFSLNLMHALTAYAQLLSYIDKRPRRVSPEPESSIEDVLILRCEGREDFSKAAPQSALVEGLQELVVLFAEERFFDGERVRVADKDLRRHLTREASPQTVCTLRIKSELFDQIGGRGFSWARCPL